MLFSKSTAIEAETAELCFKNLLQCVVVAVAKIKDPTGQAESKDGEKNQDVEGHDGVLDS